MTKFILWLSLVFGDADVLFIRELPNYNPGDWHCGKCGSLLCTVCGSCPSCSPCKHV